MNELAVLLGPLVPLVGLVSLRVGVTLAALPAPFGSTAPVPIRVLVSVFVAMVSTLPRLGALGLPSTDPAAIVRAAFGEVLVGTVIGLTVRITLAAAELGGTLAGQSMGLGFASTVDPLFEEEALPTTRLLGLLGVLIFLSISGHHVVLAALVESLRIAPPGRSFEAVAHEGIFRIGSTLLAQGLRIAAPVMATLFIVQVGVGLVSRAAPRIQLFALTFAFAVSAGLLALVVAAPTIAAAIASQVGRLPAALSAALGGP